MNGFSLYCRTSIFWWWLARFLSYCGSMKSNYLKFSIVTISPIVSNCRELCKSVVYFEKVKQIRPNTNEGKLQWKCNFQKIGSNEGDHSREMGADYVNRTHWGDCAVFITRKSKPLMMMMAQWCRKCDDIKGYECDHEIDNMIPIICLWFWCTFASPLLGFDFLLFQSPHFDCNNDFPSVGDCIPWWSCRFRNIHRGLPCRCRIILCLSYM